MKTAMQELIGELNKLYNMDYGGAKDGLRIAIDTAMNQLKSLEKEKQQLIDAWNEGVHIGYTNNPGSAESYYNETFKP